MKNKKKKKGEKLSAPQLQRAILRLFYESPKKRYNPKQVARKLKVPNNRDSILHALKELARKERLQELEDYKFKLGKRKTRRSAMKTYEGIVDMTRTGSAYIVCEGLEQDVYVSARNLNTALHGDRVEVQVWKGGRRGKLEGEVTRVLQRATEHFVGTLVRRHRHAVVVPDKMNMPFDIFVQGKDTNGARDGDKVVVRITQWDARMPRGEVVEVLEGKDLSDLEMKSILINNGFPLEFPREVLEEAADLPDKIPAQEVHRRRDMRAVPTFTIDPDDAKDFDDALSLTYLDDGTYEVGVHIADVTHYVLPGSALDKEALRRGNSVYLVDRVLPMLPEKLSNELCSLRPHEDKCTFSAVFRMNDQGRVLSRWFGKTLTHSDRRFTYSEAQEVLDTGKGDFVRELKTLDKLARRLRKERFRKGSIDFDMEEVQFRLDEDGVPIEVLTKERLGTHMLIEDFMLLANREVATYIHNKGKQAQEIPFVYRIHDLPDPEKVAELARFAAELGFKMDISSPEAIAHSFNRLTEAARKDDTLHLLAPIAIRTMAKAAYSTDNIGHYGLGFKYYCHFTSPIRRYADVLVHRILEKNLGGKIYREDKNQLELKCKHISVMERRALDAERESIKYKQVEFMQNHVGEVFEGVVSGIIERGFFVELLGNKCEGMVSFDSVSEPFELQNGRLSAQGIYTRRTIKIGDHVRVRILKTDLTRRQIDMAWVEEEG